jgi:hypothetical protein
METGEIYGGNRLRKLQLEEVFKYGNVYDSKI